MKKLARAKAKDRQASGSARGSMMDHDSNDSQDDDSTGTNGSVQMTSCGPLASNPHAVHYSDRSELRRICVVCSKRQHFLCPSCNSFMCLGPCFVKHHS